MKQITNQILAQRCLALKSDFRVVTKSLFNFILVGPCPQLLLFMVGHHKSLLKTYSIMGFIIAALYPKYY